MCVIRRTVASTSSDALSPLRHQMRCRLYVIRCASSTSSDAWSLLRTYSCHIKRLLLLGGSSLSRDICRFHRHFRNMVQLRYATSSRYSAMVSTDRPTNMPMLPPMSLSKLVSCSWNRKKHFRRQFRRKFWLLGKTDKPITPSVCRNFI